MRGEYVDGVPRRFEVRSRITLDLLVDLKPSAHIFAAAFT